MKKLLSLLLISTLCTSVAITACAGETDLNTKAETAMEEAAVTPVYANDELGIVCNGLDSSWEIADKEELLFLSELEIEKYLDKSVTEILEEEDYVLDFSADGDDYASIEIGVENLENAEMSLEEYLATYKEDIAGSFEEMGLGDITVDLLDYTFADYETKAIKISIPVLENTIYEKIVFVKVDNHIYSFSACTINDDETDILLGYFTSL